MTPHRLAAIVLAALLSALALATHRDVPRHVAPSPGRPPAIAAAVPSERRPQRSLPRARVRARQPSRAVARAFLTAFLALERNTGGAHAAHAIRAAATPALARTLTDAPARRPPGRAWPPPAHVRRLVMLAAGTRAKAIATLHRGRRSETLELLLRRDSTGRWRVTGLG